MRALRNVNETVFAVDVDAVVVDTPKLWYDWIQEKSGQTPDIKGVLPYDLGSLFNDLDFDPMDWWKSERLYDGLQPIEGSVEALETLHNKGLDIVFVSYCKGNHGHSKYDFLEKHFPFLKGAIWTREKQFTRCHAIIDDRLENLVCFDDSVVKFLYTTNYAQTVEPEGKIFKVDNWKQIKEYADGL